MGSVAERVQPLVEALLGDPPVRIEFWDGSALGPALSGYALTVKSPEALKHLMWAPGELGLARAFASCAP